MTVSDPSQIVQVIPLGADGNGLYKFDPGDFVTIQPGETLTVAAQTVTGTAGYVLGTLNTREEH